MIDFGMIDVIVLNIFHILIPFSIYLFYVACKKEDDKRSLDLAIIITIFTTLYIVLKYNVPIFDEIPIFIINIPLMVSYYKKNFIAIIVSSIIIIFYHYSFYDNFLIIFTLEYLSYIIIYILFKNKFDIKWFVVVFTIIKTIVLTISTLDFYILGDIIGHLSTIFLSACIFIIDTVLVFYILTKASELLRIRMSAKEIEHDKQIRTTLFQITHEIKNPIAVCKGYLDMFDTDNPKHSKKYIPVIKEEINKTLNLLEDYLSLNRVKINREPMDIIMLLEQFIKNFKTYFKEKDINIVIDIPDDEIYIDGDYNRLSQVFLNIIKNSEEALKDNKIIELKAEKRGSYIYVFFKDYGEGIPKNIIEKIKEPFFTTKQKGTGLGVSLSYSIIEGHDGKMTYESEYGEYTLVTVKLPTVEFL